MSRTSLPAIALTIGDPAGIGPEVLLKALADPAVFALANWTVVGSVAELRRHAAVLKIPRERLDTLRIVDTHMAPKSEIRWGEVTPESGGMALSYIENATRLCLDNAVDAMVTAPANKEAIALTGQNFVGHTEHIARLCGVSRVRMLLANPRLSVVHVTTHRSLRSACALESEAILTTILLGHEAMQLLGIATPRIAVCGLNPHAGENGLFGDEDERFIRPAVMDAARAGIDCSGPFPADTLFMKGVRGSCDLIVAMYHDQGHVPMKVIDFENTVNVTLGLPIIRTSVDHGTGFDIVGQNLADPTSMKAAMKMAVRLALGGKSREALRATSPAIANTMRSECEAAIIDLSHALSAGTPFFSGETGVRLVKLESAGGIHSSGRRSLNCSRLDTNVHCGTHMDAPFHFHNDGSTIDQIPLGSCIGPAVLMDIRSLAPREEVRVRHLLGQRELLKETKRVVFCTGWWTQWDYPHYFTDYPVLSGEAAEYLVSLGVKLVGVDTPSVDAPPFPAHLSLLGAGVVIVENLTNLDRIPAGKFHLTVAPIKSSGADASPARAFSQLI